MKSEAKPVFVERRTYRRRRLADAARLLPVFGAMLLSIPMFWTGSDGQGASTTYVMFYVFAVWIVLALIAAFISARLHPGDDVAEPGKDE